jgi:uncharacterized protein YlxW (UPF0749 family)
MIETFPGMTKVGATLSSSGLMVWAFTGASVAEAMGIAIGLIGAAYAVAAFLKDKQLQLLEADNRYLAKDHEKLRQRIEELEEQATKYRARGYEAEERRRNAELLGAADMLERFREQRHREGPSEQPPPG